MSWVGPYLAQLKGDAEARMLDTAVIRRKTGGTTQDPETGSTIPEYADVFFTPCRLKTTRTYGVQNEEVGGRTAQTVVREFHIPVDSPQVYPDDVAVMVEVHPSSDPSLEGVSLTLSGPSPGSQVTARRIEVLEVVA